MRAPWDRAAAVLVVVTLAVGGCRGRSTEAACPEMTARYLPAGFSERERSREGPGIVVVYHDRTGQRELSLLSGVPTDPHGGATPTGETVVVRGHEVQVMASDDTRFALWLERPATEPCHLYAVIGVGIHREEFSKVLAGIR